MPVSVFIELFLSDGALDPAQQRGVALRLGTIHKLGAGAPENLFQARLICFDTATARVC